MRINKKDIIVDITYGDLNGYKGISMGYLNGINYWISIWIYFLDTKEYVGILWDYSLGYKFGYLLWISTRIKRDIMR
jgi:hypothetical protein